VNCAAARWSARVAACVLGLAMGLAAASVSTAEPDRCGDCRYSGDLDALFPAPEALGPGWELVEEAPVDPLQDRELHASGVRAMQALHYTRAFRGRSEVCSVEIWSFTNADAARRAHAGFERDGWQIGQQGNLLVMLHGVTLQRGEGFRPGLLPVCRRLADLTEAEVEARLRRTGTPRPR
jgi:hypothetical protein